MLNNCFMISSTNRTAKRTGGNTMRKIKITAANKKHFDSLIRDFRNNGFMLVTYGRRLAELETETEFVIIEY